MAIPVEVNVGKLYGVKTKKQLCHSLNLFSLPFNISFINIFDNS